MAPITTLLFDCDNTLVLSEHVAFSGCAELVNQIMRELGIPLGPFTGESLQRDFVGQNFRGMLTNVAREHNVPISPAQMEAYVKQEEDIVISRLGRHLEPCKGVDKELSRLAAAGNYTLAVVSSSALRRVNVCLEKVGQKKYFGDRVFSAATSLPQPTSKPDPAVYNHAMAVLGKTPAECVAIEDSRSGALSATRAGIPTIGYLGAYPVPELERMAAELTDAGCVMLMFHWDEFEDCLAKLSVAL